MTAQAERRGFAFRASVGGGDHYGEGRKGKGARKNYRPLRERATWIAVGCGCEGAATSRKALIPFSLEVNETAMVAMNQLLRHFQCFFVGGSNC